MKINVNKTELSSIERMADVVDRYKCSESTIRRMINQGTFPKPRKIGKRAIGFLESELCEWEKSLITDSQHGQEV